MDTKHFKGLNHIYVLHYITFNTLKVKGRNFKIENEENDNFVCIHKWYGFMDKNYSFSFVVHCYGKPQKKFFP